MTIKLNQILTLFLEILSVRKYLISFFVVSLLFTLIEAWLTNYSLIGFVFRGDAFTWTDRLSILWNTVILFFTVPSYSTQIFALIIALLVGLNITLLIYYFGRFFKLQSAAGTSFVGVALSLVGVGCTACGSVLLSSLLGFAFTTKLLTVLPLQGKEFNLLAITALLISVYFTSRKIIEPVTCKIQETIK